VLTTSRARHGRAYPQRTGRHVTSHGVGTSRKFCGLIDYTQRRSLERRVRRRHGSPRQRVLCFRSRRASNRAPPSDRWFVCRDRASSSQGRQRPLRPRLRKVHHVLPVRGCLWGAVAEHVCHRCRRARLRHSHLDRVQQRTHRFSVRLLRQLRPGVPDRRVDVPKRTYDARRGHLEAGGADGDRHDLSVLRRWLSAHAPRARRAHRQSHLTQRPLGHPRQPLHQRPLRLRVRPKPRPSDQESSTVPRTARLSGS
jgi:hypothetical protein